jgi:DNA-binding beta-propeller fold protein YncE
MTISPDGKNAYAASLIRSTMTVFDRNTVTGELTQKPGTAGCISEDGTGGLCQDGTALNGVGVMTVSPDGRNVYAAAAGSGAVAVFDRNTVTGELTQKAGTAGCISEDGTGGSCQDGTALTGANSVTVSPDGRNVYATGILSDAVVIFDRNPTTGDLAQKAGTAGCISEDGTGGLCQDGTALVQPNLVNVSSDGRNVYATGRASDAVVVFDRNPTTGDLAQKAGTAGCISEDGSGGLCQDGTALDGANIVTVSPDGRNVYATAQNSDSVVVFDRNPTTGGLIQKTGTAGCISEDGTGGLCQDGIALDVPDKPSVSTDGLSLYVAANGSSAVAAFDRDPTTGALTQKSGTAGCVSATGMGGSCQVGVALTGPNWVAISPDDQNIYVASSGSSAVTAFNRR